MTLGRVRQSLDRLGHGAQVDGARRLLIPGERATLWFTLSGGGPLDREPAMLSAHVVAHSHVPMSWEARALTAANEWNNTRRLLRCFVGAPSADLALPLTADMYVPLGPGVHDALLDELMESVAVSAQAWVDWLHDDAMLI
ncbi:YbjN domain-containing protein [Fodinicola feengrottensis]|uniref:YbjN domain-containing protein n=1 Tax=Fodinicola feengrottensis TaxID=435914 RepID=A0ABN2I8K3_9ACTN|nr:YbjN domain-containing protein [Fodinicola feengrottensis]